MIFLVHLNQDRAENLQQTASVFTRVPPTRLPITGESSNTALPGPDLSATLGQTYRSAKGV